MNYSTCGCAIRLGNSDSVRSICSVCDSHFWAKTRLAFIAFSSIFAVLAINTIFTVMNYSADSRTIRLSNSESVRTICSVCDSRFWAETRFAFIAFIAFSSIFAVLAINTIFAVMNYSTFGCAIWLGDTYSVCSIIIIRDADFRTESILTISTV